MKKTLCTLSNFQILRPQHESSQEQCIQWLISAHTKAENRLNNLTAGQTDEFEKQFTERFMHVGCKPDKIGKRGHELPDFLHHRWPEMQVYNLDLASEGAGLKLRQEIHSKFAGIAFEKYYPDSAYAPGHLIHVSCTGYESPSSAQALVSKRGWGKLTQVTHAYHMGCYASVPAIRIASSFVQQDNASVDVVHTELCSLHCNPSDHGSDQIVLQSLFADGYIKYSVGLEEGRDVPGFRVLGLQERIIPESIEAMTWKLTGWGFKGTLSRRIPALIAKHVADFISDFCEKIGVDKQHILSKGVFAIHPGGPKILDHIQKILGLSDTQLQWSRAILQQYGNISSATLPHIWESVLADPVVPRSSLVMSLAFGPGLNIAGALLEKR